MRFLLSALLVFPGAGFAVQEDPLLQEQPCVSDVLEQGKQSVYDAQGVTNKLVASLRLAQEASFCRRNDAIERCHANHDQSSLHSCILQLEKTVKTELAAANSLDIPEPLARIRDEEYPKLQSPPCEEIMKRAPASDQILYPIQTCEVMGALERLRSIRFLNRIGQLTDVDWSSEK